MTNIQKLLSREQRVLSFLLIVYFVSQEVRRQMDSVHMELLSRQALQDPSSSIASSPSAQAPQRKGKRDGRRGRGVGLFRAADPLDWEDGQQ